MSLVLNDNGSDAQQQQQQKRQIQWRKEEEQQVKNQAPKIVPKLQFMIAVCFLTIFLNIDATLASQDLLPNFCDSVKCPPLSDIICPDDSDIRENFLPLAAALLSPLASETTSSPAQQQSSTSIVGGASAEGTSTATTKLNNSTNDELYAQCCLSKKCICRTCYIPDCDKDLEFVVELVPESPGTPGHCCGQYECQKEPNCTEVRDTESYWLRDCQRCKCYSGERMCHQSCDEGIRKPTAICKSKNLNQYFQQGDTWKDGCYECECVNGEEKCAIPFCRSVNCPAHRQVLLKDSCCPICWPKGIRMPNGNGEYDDEDDNERVSASGSNQFYDNTDDDDDDGADRDGVDDYDEPLAPLQPQPTDNYAAAASAGGNELDTLLPDINFEKDNSTSKPVTIYKVLFIDNGTTSTATTITAQTTTTAPVITPKSPCMFNEAHAENAPATYKVYPEVVEVVRQTDQSYMHYIIIGVLGLVIIVLVAWNVHLRHKQRSYRPVSNFDDNFNKMTPNIKKMNDYV